MEITGLKPVMPRAAIFVPNPDYATAAFEAVVLGSPETLKAFPANVLKVADWHVPRYNFVNGQYIQVPHYILQA